MLRSLLVLLVLLFALPARAEGKATPAASAAECDCRPENAGDFRCDCEEGEPRYLDYRGYLLASDVASLAFVIGGAALGNEASTPIALTGVGVYALGAPAIHVAHDQPGRGLASLAMRVGFPMGGGALGVGIAATTCHPGPDDGLSCLGAAIVLGGAGLLGGVLTAVIVDDSLLGKVERKDAGKRARASGATVGVAPFIDPKGKGGGVAVAGVF